MPKISVIVPVYKVEEYLSFCVDSILAQTFTDYELILVDDGSPDRCGEICDEYAARDSRVRVIHRENGGPSAARNSGLDIATGEYIAFIDSDDVVAEMYLEVLYQAICNTDADISMCQYVRFASDDTAVLCQETNSPCELFTGKDICLKIYHGLVSVGVCGKMFQRSFFTDTRFPVGKIHEDSAIIPIVIQKAKAVAFFADKLYWYRENENSITKVSFSPKRYDHLWAIESCIRSFEELGEETIADAAKWKRELLICTYYIRARNNHVKVPNIYRTNIFHALRFIKRNTSDDYYSYYLAMISPSLVRLNEYAKKAKQLLSQ